VGTQALVKTGERELIRQDADELTNVQRLGGLLAASGFFADAREMAQAAVKVLAGRELGIPPVASMMGINIIKGKVALGGNLIASRIRAHGYDYRHEQFDDKGCVLVFLSKIEDGKRTVLGKSSFTLADAERAQIKSDMYQKYPRNMFFNRAISNGAKWYCAEVFAGSPVYVPEELGAEVDEEGNVVHPEGQSKRPPMQEPYRATDADLPAELQAIPDAAPKVISEAQRKLLIVAAKEGGHVDAEGRLDTTSVKVVLGRFGFDSSTKVTEDKFGAIQRALRGEPEAIPEERA
jgi:hypothetical protein